MLGDNFRIEFTNSGQDTAGEEFAQLWIFILQLLQNYCRNHVANRWFNGPGPAGIRFAGKHRSSTKQLSLLAIIDHHVDSPWRKQGDRHQPFLDHIKVASRGIILLEDVEVGREFLLDSSLSQLIEC